MYLRYVVIWDKNDRNCVFYSGSGQRKRTSFKCRDCCVYLHPKTVLKSIIDYETPSVLVYFDYIIINFVIFNGFCTNFILDHRYFFFEKMYIMVI